MKSIVISAVNIVEAGPLTILKDCLCHLSQWVAEQKGAYKVVAIVHHRALADYPHIEYMETQWPKKRWINRLWYEYVSLRKVSKDIGEVYLWFSLHDTTPSVKAERRAVYCHNALFGYRWKLHDLFFAPKMTVMAMLTKYIYRSNIHQNDFLIVQQAWFRDAMSKMFNIHRQKIIVAPPARPKFDIIKQRVKVDRERGDTFIYAASPNNHKNFEVICQAVDILNNEYQIDDFKVYITIRGNENRYAKWLYKTWGKLVSLEFVGFLSKDRLRDYYETCDCLIFPSKVESWGLPISEFAVYDKYMLLADLPYTHETAGGSNLTAFFDPDSPKALAEAMKKLIQGDDSLFKPVPVATMTEPIAKDWSALFSYLLSNHV